MDHFPISHKSKEVPKNKKELAGKVEEPEGEEKEMARAGAPLARAGRRGARAGRRGARAGVSADDGKDQQHFERSLGKRTEKKEKEIVLVVCLVISSHV